MFEWEHEIAVHIMKGNQASSRGDGQVSCFFSSGARNLRYILDLGGDDPSKLLCVQRHQDSCLVMKDTSGIFSRLGRAIQTVLEVRRETQATFLVATVILGFRTILRKSQASSPFEALNSVCLSVCQRDVRTPVQIRLGPRAFSRDSTRDSDIPSSCEMKDKPAFKPLQGNPAFFQVRASRCSFPLSQQTHGTSHIPIHEGIFLLRCLWKVGIPLQSNPGNQLSARDDLGCTEFSSSCCAEIGVPLYLRRVSQGISEVA